MILDQKAGASPISVLHRDHEELPVHISVARDFAKNLTKSAPFHASRFYTKAHFLLRKRKAVFLEHRAASNEKYLEFWSTTMFHTRTTSILLLQMISSYICLQTMPQGTVRVDLRSLGLKVFSVESVEPFRTFPRTLILHS